MNNEQFDEILNKLGEYLKADKTFVQNPFRVKEMIRAVTILRELFPHYKMEIKDDPLQMGAQILTVDAPDVVIRTERERELFAEFTSLVDNFEIVPKGSELHFAAVLQDVLIRV